jgi:hypothetical protein
VERKNEEESMKYEPLPTASDLGVESFRYAMIMTNPPFYLHVHPLNVERAKTILADPRSTWPGRRDAPMFVVPDDTLNDNEWYISSAVGSNPP